MIKGVLVSILSIALVACGQAKLEETLFSSTFVPYSGTDVVQTPPAPFNQNSLINTVAQVSTLSRPYIQRVTGPATDSKCQSYVATQSGGEADVMTNTNTSLIVMRCDSGFFTFLGYNPTNTQDTTTSTAACPGDGAFSRVNLRVFYCRPDAGKSTPLGIANGSTFYVITFGITNDNSCGLGLGQCADPVNFVWSQYFDFAGCPQAPGGMPTHGSAIGIGADDFPLATSLSWTGGQGTARYVFAYAPADGCYTLDTMTDMFYAPGKGAVDAVNLQTGAALLAMGGVHDITANSKFVQISITNCTGIDCPTPLEWSWYTNGVYSMGENHGSGGHSTLSANYFINAANPNFNRRTVTTPGTENTIAATNCSPCEDSHLTANIKNDTDLVLGETDGLAPATWIAPYKNEILGLTVDGSQTIYRYSPTWSSGASSTETFEGQFAIGAADQRRHIWFFTSDMLCGLGTYQAIRKGVLATWCRTDVFAIGLDGRQ